MTEQDDRQSSKFWYGLVKRRVFESGRNSIAGLTSCFAHEEAFRIESIIGALLVPVAFWVSESIAESLLLITTIVLVLITELLNSAVEATVDRVGLDYHDLAKRAKDIGSAAVFLSLMLFIVIWGTLLVT